MVAKKSSETPEEVRSRVWETVAIDDKLDGVDLRVFLYLSARVGFEAFVHVPQIELATMLVRRKEHISRAIRRLLQSGVIEASPKGVRASEWRINRDYGK